MIKARLWTRGQLNALTAKTGGNIHL